MKNLEEWWVEKPPVVYTEKELKAYENYVWEWEYRVRSNRNGFTDWGISNHQGDPWSMKEWKERDYLHHFQKGMS